MHTLLILGGGMALTIGLLILCIYYIPLDPMYNEIAGWLLIAGGLVAGTVGIMHQKPHKDPPPAPVWPEQ